MACSRTALQRLQIPAGVFITLLLLVYVLQRSSPAQLPLPADQQLRAPAAPAVWEAAEGDQGSVSARPITDRWGQNGTEVETDAIKHACDVIAVTESRLKADVRQVMRWVCQQVGGVVIRQRSGTRCNKVVTYQPIGRLGNLLNLYAIIFSFSKMYGITSYVDPGMWKTIHQYFPRISLLSMPDVPGVKWKNIAYHDVNKYLSCPRNSSTASKTEYYRIGNYPDRNGIDVFHPFYEDLRNELQFSERLQEQAQRFLRHASANHSSTTFIGFHIRRTDYNNYIRTKYNSTLPDEAYFSKALEYYRSRFSDALFIVCSDDMSYVEKTLQRPQQKRLKENNDIVIAGNRNINDPGRDMALLSACNHSIVTVGTYGFWGAYLAGGTVLVPENQTHLSMGDRHAPKLEIQLAGASNWIALR